MDLNKPKISLRSIQSLMERGALPNPYEITAQDFFEHMRIGHLGGGWDFVQKIDIGKRVYLRGKFLQMENDQQMETRKKNEKMIPNFKTNLRFAK